MKIPNFFANLPRPWGIIGDVHPDEKYAPEWNDENADIALNILKNVSCLYASGFPWRLDESVPITDRQEIILSAIDFLEPQSTYAEFSDPRQLVARLDMEDHEPLRQGEIEPVIELLLPSSIRKTAKLADHWLGKKAFNRPDWPRAPELIEMARAYVPQVYPWFQFTLLGLIGLVLREAAFPFFDEVLTWPHASEMLKKDVHYIGSTIERKINIDAFKIDPREAK